MPMDNNDNHYPGLSEENSKITSVLHPYGLPKFDFDHTHIRFDSLSENEVFLGISNREDDHWIEDFSRGNSGVEFGSSAAECCSIPRHVNVWSEATSSESVEMLLKSVGQEEMLPVESIIEESDACDELGTMAKQTDLHLRPAGNRNDQDSNLEAVHSSENSCDVLEPMNPSHGSEDVIIGPLCSSLTQVEHSASGGSVNLESSLVGREWNSQDKESSGNENQQNHGTSLNESLNFHMEGTLVHGIQACSDSSSQHVREDVEMLNGQDRSNGMPLENASNGPMQRNDCNVNDASVCRTHDAIHLSTCEFSVFAALNADATQNSNQLPNIPAKKESPFPTTKGNGQDLHSLESCQNSEDLALPESLEIKHSTDTCEKSFSGSEGDHRVNKVSLPTTKGISQDLHSLKSSHNSEDLMLPENLGIRDSTDICVKSYRGSEADPKVKESSLLTTKGNGQDLHSVESCQNSEDLVLPECLEIRQSAEICEKSYGRSEGDPTVKESSLPTTKGNSQDLHSFESFRNPEDLALPESLNIKHSTAYEKSLCGSEGDLSVHEQAASNSGVDKECEQLNDFSFQTCHTECSLESKESSQGSHDQLDKEVFTSTSERQIPETEPALGIHLIEDLDHVDDLPILADATHSSQSVAEHIAQNLKGSNGATENHEDTGLSSVSSGIVMSVEAADLGKHHSEDMISNSKPAIRYNDAARLSTLSLDEEVEKKFDVEQSLESDKPFSINSESNVASTGSNAALHERSHGITVDIAEQNVELNLPSNVEPMVPHKIADMVTDAIFGEETPSLKLPQQTKGETGIVSIAENDLVCNLLVEKVIRDNSSLSLTETRDAAPLTEGIMVHQKETLGFSSSMDVDSVPYDSNVGVAASAETVAIVKHMETKLENSRQAELSEVSGGGCFAEADKPSHGTASVISCCKLPDPDERMEVDQKEPAAEHISDSTSKPGEVPLVPKNDGASEGSRKEISFSFDVPVLAEKESGSMPSGSPKNCEGRELPQVASIVTEGGSASIGANTTSESKKKHSPAKSTKRKAKKGINVRQPEENTSCRLVNQPEPARLLQVSVGITDSTGRKSTATPIPISNLLDLNTSIPTSALFHQPFTDLQQVQLRAQIFVYGSLIQGTSPDEACMVSAFGTSDGGRTSWEPKWRACVERLHSQKTVSNNYSTPIQSRSGSKGQDKSTKQSAPRSKAVPSSVNLFGNKGTPSVTFKPMIPLSSPLWNLSTPLSDGLPPSNVLRGGPQAFPSLHPCQTPPPQTFGGKSTSGLSPAPIPGPWVSSSQCSAFNSSARLSSSPSADTVKLTSLNDSSLAISSSMKDSFNDHISDRGVSSNRVQDPSMQKITSSPAFSKSRKRSKSNTTEESSQKSLSSTLDLPDSEAVTNNQSVKGPSVAHLSSIYSHPSTPLTGGNFLTTVAETASQVAVDPTQRRELHMENNSTNRGEIRQVEKAKLAGEEAEAHAADLVSRCQSVWSALEQQRNSSIAPDCELQLSSSAAAVAAAASVAKAAAAAAKLASTAAIHFHQVAIQLLHGNATPAEGGGYSMSDVSNNLSDATPASILRGGNGNDAPNAIISAARVAARMRVEAALVASQHAENLDAIVKAAELAAKAVSQAGRVVAMGKPMPLSDLIEAGPEKCCSEKGDEKDIGCSMVEGSSLQKDIGRDMSKNIKVDEPISASQIYGGTKNCPDHAGAASLASDHADAESVPLQDANGCGQNTYSDDSIKENCTVEVFKDGGCFKGGWYSAKVLSLNDGKAHVCFTDLQSDTESDSLREWIPLEGEGNEVPNIRVTHPMSGVHFDGPRKRSRAASTEYQGSVGDRVDAWSKDCWREGVITEQNNNDPASFNVHFPAHGEAAVVKAWHLRPTLTWKNGKWIGQLTSRECAPSQGDTPHAKRLRLGSSLEVKGKGEIPKTVDNLQLQNVDEPKLLPLSATEKAFNIGSNRGDDKVEAPRMKRSGLQKEGLKFFGVPRPGKKQKFMDVSKHIGLEQSTKNDVPNDSSKLSKYLMSQGTRSREFQNGSRVDLKEKRFPGSKLKGPNTGKLPGISRRTLSHKENSTSAVSGAGEIASRSTVKGSISNTERGSSNLIRSSSGSKHEAAISALPPDRNKKASKNSNSERIMKGKLALAAGKTEAAAEDKLLPDSTGPRRSNRKIQPTSRLLEGLQSSLITSKIPSYSRDRNHRLQSKG